MNNFPAITTFAPNDDDYPVALISAFGAKAPALMAMGNLELLTKPGVGFCGSRKASDKGLDTAADCAEQCAQNDIPVVSGNAAGVDFTAHHSALNAGGATILVLPEGIHNFRVKKDLKPVWDWNRVLVVSQFEADAAWKAYRAMQRNKVILALSHAMVVIEAGETGGTLDAGLSTLKAQKPLFVAQYQDMTESYLGNVRLLNMGGVPLKRSAKTGRANIEKLQDAVRNPSTQTAKISMAQQTLF